MTTKSPSWTNSIAPYTSEIVKYHPGSGSIDISLALRGRSQNGKWPQRCLGIRGFGVGVGQSEKEKQLNRRHKRKIYLQAAVIVGRGSLKCALTDETCSSKLQIDHINGDGVFLGERGHSNFYSKIVNGQRPIDDLRILCGSHNVRERVMQ